MKRPVYAVLAQLLRAYNSCQASGNEHAAQHKDTIEDIVKNHLPSGSGFDSGTKLDFDVSKPDKLVLHADFHHMDDNGFYCGWSEHKVIVTPNLAFGIHVKVTGRDRRNIREYIGDVYHQDLQVEIDPWASKVVND